MDLRDLIPAHIRDMRPYVPTPPPEVTAERLGLAPSDIIKLDANENLWGPSPKVLEALRRTQPQLYPDPDANALRSALSDYVNVPKDQLVCGAGGDEVLDMIGRLLIQPGDVVIDTPPTFGVFAAIAALQRARYVPVMRRADFTLDVDAIERAVAEHPGAKLLYVVNPNNPDGSAFGDDVLRRLLALPVPVLLDEAYIEFSSHNSRTDWVTRHDNLMVVRTFSKLAGLAGLRVGYGAFPAWLAGHVWKLKPYFTPSVAAQTAAVAALADRDFLASSARRAVAERDRLGEMLSDLGWVHPLPSETNFLLCRIEDDAPVADDGAAGHAARRVKAALERSGILIRYFDRDGLRDCVRISVGLPEHNDALVRALRSLAD